jgi:Kdo2-lipid IVA lauroyltransferase/acyltransferase
MADEHIPENLTALRRFYKGSRLRHFVRQRRKALMYHVARVVPGPLRATSLPRALVFADRAADLAYRTLPSARRLALEHLTIALGETHSPAAREDIARQAYRNTARCVVELAKLDDIRPHFDDYVSLEGWEHFEEVHALGRGAIAVTGHLGNFHLLAAYVGYRGIPIIAVAKREDDPRINRLLTDFHTSHGVRVILRDSAMSAKDTLRVLQRRGILAMQIDIDVRVPSVSVPFFGRPARTPAAAAVLSVRRDIPVVPSFIQRRPEGGHHVTIMPPILPPKSGDRQADILELTRRFSQIIEDRIRRQPAEWYWWHRRWRRPPLPHFDLDAAIPHAVAST